MGVMLDLYNNMHKTNIIDDRKYLQKLLNFYKITSRPKWDGRGELK